MVHILLSTYNGEEYICEQLESIFNQSFREFRVYIRDDGSTDQTVKKIEQYLAMYPNKAAKTQWVLNKKNENLGYMGSFWKLLEVANGAKYYAFCDQDDVWLPDKIERGVEALEKVDVGCPTLYFSNFYQCNKDLSIRKKNKICLSCVNFENVLFYTPAFGFTILINEKLRQIALGQYDHVGLPHDGWIQKIAAAFGKIICDQECTAYYRRHEKAITANNSNKILLIKNLIQKEIFGHSMQETHEVLERFYNVYGLNLKKTDKKLLELYALREKKITVWWKRIFFKEVLRPSFAGRIALRICFFLDRY